MNTLLREKCINLKAPLLITGETGTGKSHLARDIYRQSSIHQEKFLTVHLATLKEDLLESELFGHKKGSFTGALENKSGYFQEVGTGTLFLDEIGELSLEAQKKLLYVMEERKFTPVGGSASLDFRGRIIMATNRNLKQMVESGLFREDLYYRIKVFHLELSPLREDKKQLREMIQTLFNELKERHSSPYARLSNEAMELLMSRNWKGNIREIKNALEFALVMSPKNVIESADFPHDQNEVILPEEVNALAGFPEDFHQSQELFEKVFLESMLAKNGGKVNETARRLGISKTTLIQKARKYGINTLKMRAEAFDFAA